MTVAAGLLAFRFNSEQRSSLVGLEVLLAHPGGPYWKNQDEGAWTIPKGLCEPGEDLLDGAIREFAEETGYLPPTQLDYLPIGEVKMKSTRKRVNGWAFEMPVDSNFDAANATSNMFEVEWPPKSGKKQLFPEVDEVRWFHWGVAKRMLLPAQVPLVDRLCDVLTIKPQT